MTKHRTAKQWLETIRYWSFPMSICPVVATVAYLYWQEIPVDLTASLLSVIAIVAFQAAGNLISDINDYRTGVDSEESYGVDQLVKDTFTPREYLIEAIVGLVITLGIGIILVLRGGGLPLLLLIGVAGLLLAIFYSRLKGLALGDLDIFLVYALLAICGTSYAVTGQMHPSTLVLMMPIGLITVAVLHANNTRDIRTDRKAGIRTPAMALGHRKSIRLYIAYILLPFFFVALGILPGLLPATALICFLTLPLSLRIIRSLRGVDTDSPVIRDLDQRTAMLQLGFSSTLVVGIALGILI